MRRELKVVVSGRSASGKTTVSTRHERVGPPAVTSFLEIHGSQP